MLNAPRHSDHHAHPSRPYPALRLAETGAEPMLPRSLPVMAAIAMVPPAWKQVMGRELKRISSAGNR
jgi:alkane 1-monooxygenase